MPFIASRRPRLVAPGPEPYSRKGGALAGCFATAAAPSGSNFMDPASWSMQYVGDLTQLREADALPRTFDPSKAAAKSTAKFYNGAFHPVAGRAQATGRPTVLPLAPRPKEMIPADLPVKLDQRIARNHKVSREIDQNNELFAKMKVFKSPMMIDLKFAKEIRTMVSSAVSSHVYRTFEESSRPYRPDYLHELKEDRSKARRSKPITARPSQSLDTGLLVSVLSATRLTGTLLGQGSDPYGLDLGRAQSQTSRGFEHALLPETPRAEASLASLMVSGRSQKDLQTGGSEGRRSQPLGRSMWGGRGSGSPGPGPAPDSGETKRQMKGRRRSTDDSQSVGSARMRRFSVREYPASPEGPTPAVSKPDLEGSSWAPPSSRNAAVLRRVSFAALRSGETSALPEAEAPATRDEGLLRRSSPSSSSSSGSDVRGEEPGEHTLLGRVRAPKMMRSTYKSAVAAVSAAEDEGESDAANLPEAGAGPASPDLMRDPSISSLAAAGWAALPLHTATSGDEHFIRRGGTDPQGSCLASPRGPALSASSLVGSVPGTPQRTRSLSSAWRGSSLGSAKDREAAAAPAAVPESHDPEPWAVASEPSLLALQEEFSRNVHSEASTIMAATRAAEGEIEREEGVAVPAADQCH